MENTELVLTHVNVIFAELKDKGFGRSITIDATEPAVKDAITKWVAANNINGGTPKFKEYTGKDGKTVNQYQLRLSEFTEVDGKNGEDELDLGYGAVVNLKARPFTYDNKFGKGISASLRAIFIVEPRKNNTFDGISE